MQACRQCLLHTSLDRSPDCPGRATVQDFDGVDAHDTEAACCSLTPFCSTLGADSLECNPCRALCTLADTSGLHCTPAAMPPGLAAHVFTAFSGLSCRAAVQFEMSSYDDCIATCNTAVERGRGLRADYKQVAKALTRKGNALVKKGDLEDAIEVYHKALTEHRCAQHLVALSRLPYSFISAEQVSTTGIRW